PVTLFVFIFYLFQKNNEAYSKVLQETRASLLGTGYRERLKEDFKQQLIQKQRFFNKPVVEQSIDGEAQKWADEEFNKKVQATADSAFAEQGNKRATFRGTFQELLQNPVFLTLSFVPGLLMYALILLYSNFYLKYIL